jgi:hypothetical protein
MVIACDRNIYPLPFQPDREELSLVRIDERQGTIIDREVSAFHAVPQLFVPLVQWKEVRYITLL